MPATYRAPQAVVYQQVSCTRRAAEAAPIALDTLCERRGQARPRRHRWFQTPTSGAEARRGRGAHRLCRMPFARAMAPLSPRPVRASSVVRIALLDCSVLTTEVTCSGVRGTPVASRSLAPAALDAMTSAMMSVDGAAAAVWSTCTGEGVPACSVIVKSFLWRHSGRCWQCAGLPAHLVSFATPGVLLAVS